MTEAPRTASWWTAASQKAEAVPTWAIGLVVALLAWLPTFSLAATTGLDVSWWSGLYMAAHEKLQFGQQIVFTYGPLGFMKTPWLFYSDLAAIAFVYSVAIYLGFCLGLVWSLRKAAGPIVAFVGAFLCLVLVSGIEQVVALAAFVAIGILVERPNDRNLYVYAVAGGLLASAEALMKLSVGPVVFLVLLIGLIGCRPRWGHIATYGGVFLGGVLLLWVVMGQAIPALPDFVGNSIQVVAGYDEAMATQPLHRWDPPILAALAAVTACWAWFGMYPDRRRRIAGFLIVSIVVFAYYKQGLIRMDSGHRAIFLSMLAMVWIAVPAGRRMVPFKLLGVLALSIFSISTFQMASWRNLNPVENLDRLVQQGRILFDPGRRQDIVDATRLSMTAGYGMESRLAFGMLGHSISVDPWETSVVWADRLDWSPVPVFQNYAAYTPALDQLNADAVASPDGPDRILREGFKGDDLGRGIEGRLLAWDPPAQAVATLCNFRPEMAGDRWELLRRVPDRCGEQVAAGSVRAAGGQLVEVPAPAPDEVVLVRIHGVATSVPRRLVSLLYRPPMVYVATGEGTVFRLVPALAGDGLMLRSGRRVKDARGRFAPVPQTRSIAVNGAGGDLEFEFFRMKVR